MRIAMIGQKGIEIGERGGGVEAHVDELSRHLARLGHEVVVYARKRYGNGNHPQPLLEKEGGRVVVRFVPTVYRKNIEAILHTFLCTMDALFRRYDIVHYHGVGPATLAWIPRVFKPKCRVIVTFHSQDQFHKKWSRFAKTYLRFGEWAACRFPHATISVSHVLQVYARNTFKRQIVYIPNGAHVQRGVGTDQLAQFGLEPRGYLLNVSRLVPHKRQDLLIEAYQGLQVSGFRGQVTVPKLVFVGASTYTSEYEQRLKDLAAGDPNILFLGYQSGEALRQLFAHAYVYVQPSEAEGLPVVVLEAMSFGTPVLVSDIPENLEAIHYAGFTFTNRSMESLSESLGELIRHSEMVEEAATHVQNVVDTRFNWDVIAEHTEEVYRSVRH